MADVEIKRGYEVLPDNNVRFGIKITNISDLIVSDVEVILDYTESLFNLEGERVQKLGNIPPANTRTAEFVLKPLGCVHKVNIEALISYRDAKYNRQRVDMHPKEVHCVCPFLKGMKMSRAEFLEHSGTGNSAETGLNFKGVDGERLASFLVQTCKSRHYNVDDFFIDGGRMLYLASESIGEKAYYLLTALIKESKGDGGLTQVMLRAVSDKPYGLNGFLNEIVADLRHVVSTVQSAQEIGIIKKEQVINIIDSVVQRTNFGVGGASVNIQDSVVQRTEFDAGEDRRVEEEEDKKAREKAERERKEKERKAREEQETARREQEKQNAREEQERIAKKKGKTRTNLFMLVIVLGALLVGFAMFAPGSDNSRAVSPLSIQPTEKATETPTSEKATKNRIATIETEKGIIKFELYEKRAPITTANFIKLAESGFYEGLIFHRIVPGFVIQGGDPQGTGMGGSDETINLEIHPELRHIDGAVAMARSNDRNSASSQFYITLGSQPNLDDDYAVFGQVIEGKDVVAQIVKGDKMLTVTIGTE